MAVEVEEEFEPFQIGLEAARAVAGINGFINGALIGLRIAKQLRVSKVGIDSLQLLIFCCLVEDRCNFAPNP